ncbi:hypothetical protein Ancab_025464 [Ancistrocladus abbreviatus]
MKTRSCLLFARSLVHTTKLECIDERMNIRVDGVLLQIRASEEMVSSEEMLDSEVAASDRCKKIYPTLSLVVPASPSHVVESIFNDQKESPVKPFLGMDGGITTKQYVTRSKQMAQNRANIYEGGGILNCGTSRVRSGESLGLREKRERPSPSIMASSDTE